MVALSLRAWWRLRQSGGVIARASSHAIARSRRKAFVLGCLWGLAAAVFFPIADGPARTVVASIAMGMIAGGGAALAPLPAALRAYLAPLFAGNALALALSHQPSDAFLAILLCVFTFIIYRAAINRSDLIRANLEHNRKLADQSSIIELLLKEFEEGASDWLWQTDAEGRPVRGEERMAQFFAVEAGHLKTVGFGGPAEHRCADPRFDLSAVDDCLENRRPFRGLVLQVSGDEGPCWLSISGKPVFDGKGAFAGFRGVASDITAARRAERRTAYLAHHDPLTGVANRARFAEEIAGLFGDYFTRPGGAALLYLNLDNFKLVNDRSGHAMGDQLLREVAGRLTAVVAPGDTVARIGGDEFAIIARSAGDESAASALAQAILDGLQVPVQLAAEQVAAGCSIGVAFVGTDGIHVQDLMRNADLALYDAKAAGKRTFRFFEVPMARRLRERHRLEQDLRRAIERDELVLNYQPLVDRATHATVGFEALLRWDHAELGRIPPDQFIPMAEQIGAIEEIGAWVVRQACLTASRWPETLSIAVNVSARQFVSGEIERVVRAALDESGLAPHRLELEITESLFIDNPARVVEVLHALKGMGVRIALDDFGTGYSSLSYLRRFPFDKLKINRSFVSAVKDDPVAYGVLETIMMLGRVLDLRVTAEGVEDTEPIEILSRLTCAQLQGYYFSRPMAEADVAGYLLKELQKALHASGVPQLAFAGGASG